MSSSFEDESTTYHVLVNNENRPSLWPEFADVPDGWQVVLRSASRAECIDYVNEHWTDMRPKSLADAMSAEGR